METKIKNLLDKIKKENDKIAKELEITKDDGRYITYVTVYNRNISIIKELENILK